VGTVVLKPVYVWVVALGAVEVEEEASTPGKPRMVVYRTPAAVRARLARVRVTVVEICG
jgi:hypothetical protein